MANNAVDLRHVRDNLGQESISTTSHYTHADGDARHRETQEHHKSMDEFWNCLKSRPHIDEFSLLI